MKQYHNLLRTILENGEKKSDRTGTGTRSGIAADKRLNSGEIPKLGGINNARE